MPRTTRWDDPARTALVVDDDPAILDLLTEILGDAGFATTCFASGVPAEAALAQQGFDLLLIDQWLPDMNGLRLCEVARDRYGNAAVVVLITADTRLERQVTALTTWADDVVGKPFDNEVLVARIEAKLRRRGRVAA